MTRVIVCRVGRLPVMEELAQDERGGHLSAMQRIVGGLVDCVALPDGCDLWCNDEGRLLELPLNRMIDVGSHGVKIHGDFIIARVSRNGDTTSATDEDFRRYLELFEREDTMAAQWMAHSDAAKGGLS